MQVLSRQRGVSLIEVLVAIAIFSVGVLGIALMQIKGSQFSKQAGARTVAVLQARSLADAMRANPAGVYGLAGNTGDLSGSYYKYDGTAAPDSSSCADVACKQAANDLNNWLTELKAGTATPVASVQPNPNAGTLTIKVSWKAMSPGVTNDTTTDAYQFDYQP